MVNVQQVTVEVEVRVPASLDSRIGGLIGIGARRKGKLGKDGKWREGDAGQALCGEGGLVDDDFLDLEVGRLRPVGGDGRHGRCRGLLCCWSLCSVWWMMGLRAGVQLYALLDDEVRWSIECGMKKDEVGEGEQGKPGPERIQLRQFISS